ncbi:unnamed protein product [Arabidopsis thaliana]|uniref:Uncharacterized protein n=1 Tax=Arabidopsis thaliana TaxID=3702 RepID=A0A5S9XRU1_ARATH|nr:unnamed protein product [Arabidopsis thaliana]
MSEHYSHHPKSSHSGRRRWISSFTTRPPSTICCEKGRTSGTGTFFLSPRKGFRVIEDFSEKDENWRKSFFFFLVNELTFGNKTDLFVSEWAARAARVEKSPISKTFAAHFSSFCRQDLGWEALTNDKIRA